MTSRAHVVAAGVAVSLMIGCTDALVPRSRGVRPVELFDLVWQDFDRYYASFEIKGVDWNDVRRRFRPQAESARTDAQIAATIGQMLVELRDPHVDLAVPPRTFYVSLAAPRTYFDPNTTFGRYVTAGRMTPTRKIWYGMIGADLGYIRIVSFGGTGWSGEIDTAIESLQAAKAFILDVRDNGGGNDRTAEEIASRFATGRYRYAYIRYRNGPRHGDFADLIAKDIAPIGPKRFGGPVIALTNRRAVSAAEDFVLAMRARPNTELLGDTTTGGLGNPMVRELPNGWTFRVPQWIQYGPGMEVFEGIGIGPTVVVPHSAADSAAGRDPQLEAAIARVRLRIP